MSAKRKNSAARILAPLAGLSWLLLTCPAAAQAQRFELSWRAPVGCPARADVAREVQELIADSASAARVTPIVAEATVKDDPGGFALTLSVRDSGAPRSRHIGAPTCEELAHAAALIVAIAIDPTILERRADTNHPGPISKAGEVGAPGAAPSRSVHCRLTDLPLQSSAPPPQTQPKITQSPTEPLFWRLGFGTFAAVNVLPNVEFGMNLLGALQGKFARFEVAASALYGEAASAVVPNRSGTFSLYRVAPKGCWLVAGTAWATGPCVGMQVGILSGKGHGVDIPSHPRSLWLASSVGGMFEWRVASSALVLFTADLGVPLQRDVEFRLAGEQLYKPSISGSFGVNLAAGWR